MSMFKEINDFRVKMGLKPIVRKKTQCLTCNKEFESKDYPRQQLCLKCRSRTDDFLSFDVRQDLILAG